MPPPAAGAQNPRNAKNNEDVRVLKRVFWGTGSVIPLAIVSVKLHVPCVICMDSFTASEGFSCSNGHFICWESCFDGYVKTSSEPGAVGRSVDISGNLKCPECTEIYDPRKVAAGGPAHVYDALIALKTTATTQRALEQVRT